jgi:hypothetical protein
MENSNNTCDDNINTNEETNSTIVNKSSAASKVIFAITKKKKKSSAAAATATTQIQFESSHDHAEESVTVAAIAEQQSLQREKDGIKLVIPLEDERNKNEPLLSGLKRIIEQQQAISNDTTSTSNAIAEHDNSKNDNDQETQKNNLQMQSSLDAQATEALIQDASTNKSTQDKHSTNFSASGNLIIQSDKDATTTKSRMEQQKQMQEVDDTIKYKRDLENRAEDIDVESSAYISCPISEFGAAMLRGMGWKGNNDDDRRNSKDKKDEEIAPRPHRLGLGATPLPPSIKNGSNGGVGGNGARHRARKGGSMKDIAHVEKQEEEERKWKRLLEEKRNNDIQLTLNVGSVVRIRLEDGNVGNKRGKMVKIAGVPGLNRVLVQFEGDVEDTSVKKGDVVLVEKAELEAKPFEEMKSDSSRHNLDRESRGKSDGGRDERSRDERVRDSRSRGDRGRDSRSRNADRHRDEHGSRSRSRSSSHGRDRKRQKRERRSRSRSRSHERSKHHRSRNHRDSENDHSRSRKPRRDRDSERESRRRDEKDHKRSSDKSHKNRNNEGFEDGKRDEQMKSHKSIEHWLTTNIRVRVVTKKIAKGRQFKEKGIVLDVLKRGAEATIQMANGEILERVPERYLETALPKIGGNAIILTGPNKSEKGKLLEKHSDKGRGILQLFEDMNVVTLSLDDIAEFCGALDDAIGDY